MIEVVSHVIASKWKHGSRRTIPCWPTAAAVVSELQLYKRHQPSQKLQKLKICTATTEDECRNWNTCWVSASIDGHWPAATVKRAFVLFRRLREVDLSSSLSLLFRKTFPPYLAIFGYCYVWTSLWRVAIQFGLVLVFVLHRRNQLQG